MVLTVVVQDSTLKNPADVPDTGTDIAFAANVNREDSPVPLFYSRYAKHSLR
jgi:hypothetical protein